MALPALPDAKTISPLGLAVYGAELVSWAETVDDVSTVRDAANKWAAITEYVRRTSREGVAEAEAALRRLEARVGALLGPAPTPQESGARKGAPANAPSAEVHRNQANDFRLMADHPDVVEEVIAASTDADPPSRRKVVGEIKRRQQAADDANEDALLRAELEARGFDLNPSPEKLARMRRESYVIGELLLILDEVAKLATEHPAETCTDLAHRLPTVAEFDAAITYLTAMRGLARKEAA